MKAHAYLAFNGTCEEAFKFYEKNLGAKIETLVTYGETPAAAGASPDILKKIIHGRLSIGDTLLMGADAPSGHYKQPQGISILLRAETPAEAEKMFLALSEQGKASMPIQETFFAQRFGMLTDAFDIPWMIICEKKV